MAVEFQDVYPNLAELTSGFFQIYSTYVIVFQSYNLNILFQVFIWSSP